MKIRQFIDIICPEHDRNSCSDKLTNNIGRCSRCNLLYVEKEGKLPNGVKIPYIPCEVE